MVFIRAGGEHRRFRMVSSMVIGFQGSRFILEASNNRRRKALFTRAKICSFTRDLTQPSPHACGPGVSSRPAAERERLLQQAAYPSTISRWRHADQGRTANCASARSGAIASVPVKNDADIVTLGEGWDAPF